MGEKREILEKSEVIHYAKDEKIIREGEVEPFLYAILEGVVHVMKSVKHTDDAFIASLGKGDIFGEAAIFIRMPRTADIVAGEGVRVLRIQRKYILQFIRNNHESGMNLLLVMMYCLMRKLKLANTELSYDRQIELTQKEIDQLLNGNHWE